MVEYLMENLGIIIYIMVHLTMLMEVLDVILKMESINLQIDRK